MNKKPNILISACLNKEDCRYNGQTIPFPWVENLKDHVNFINVCPEVEMGLSTPRNPIRLVKSNDKVEIEQPKDDRFVTNLYQDFEEEFIARTLELDGAILKAKSPSCGIIGVKLYKNDVPLEATSGVFTQSLNKHYSIPMEEEGRLRNYELREHFLIQIFCFFEYREAFASNKIGEVMKVHAAYKYLFMAYNQDILRNMGRLLADQSLNFEEKQKQYLSSLKVLFKEPASYKNRINSLLHIFGYFKPHIESVEKTFFLDQLDKYRNQKIPFSSVTTLLNAWVIKYDIDYLKGQKIFDPFPEDLMNVSDSGKGIIR